MKKMASKKDDKGQKSEKGKKRTFNVSLLLHNIRSVHNVGSIFRTADAFGVKKIFVSGCTPTPVDRFGRKRADLAKVSLGAEDTVPWERVDEQIGEQVETSVRLVKKFKEKWDNDRGTVIALEQDPQAIDYREVGENLHGEILLILGGEIDGIDRDILDIADIIAEIPMRGKKESLNVSVAAGIALFGMFG